LQETTIRYCGEESEHRVFLRADEEVAGSPCLDFSWVNCETAREHFASQDLPELPARSQCPLLREKLVQYCDASPVRTYVPFVHGLLSRCQNDGYRYCPLYLQRERPEVRLRGRSVKVGDLTVATDRSYSPNHMWIDEGELGQCHIGIDAFAAWIFDYVSVVHFVSRRGLDQPHVILGNEHVQLDLVFPARLEITEANAHLRSHPDALLEDPYGAGWIFEGQLAETTRRSDAERGLVPGDAAEAWMKDELDRLDGFVRDQLPPAPEGSAPTCADGGTVRPALTAALPASQNARLFHDFFRTPTGGRR
jgi:glycine cleavage system H lipoate-binding protein